MSKVLTGVPGLDDILFGGLERDRLYVVVGEPGMGKTTLALQFLLEGLRNGERCLYVTLTETREEIEQVARSHGWSIDGLSIFEFRVSDEKETGSSQTVFHTAEVDLAEAMGPLGDEIERVRPDRIVVDSVADIRLLAREDWHLRRQVLDLKSRLMRHRSTALLLDDDATHANGVLLTLAHGVLQLRMDPTDYGRPRRRLSVSKLRGSDFREGYHDFQVVRGGLVVYPRLVAAEHTHRLAPASLSTGIVELDQMLGGGLDAASSVLLTGASGVGKSSLATQVASHFAASGGTVAAFLFDESKETFAARAASLGIALEPHLESGRFYVQQIDPAELSPGELSNLVRLAVERDGARMVVIDSLNGYLNSVPGERFLLLHMHELLGYLAHRGVTTLLCVVQHGTLGPVMHAGVDVSYLSDTILLMRYFEQEAEVRKVISVVKRRAGQHERMLRELVMGSDGIRVGSPIRGLRGILTGQPVRVEANADAAGA